MNFWDERFSEPGYKYGTSPNAFLVAQAHRLPSTARVLVPGDGEGRNGVWLAQQGHRVTSVDSSPVGLAKARALAQERGVSLDTECVDLAEWAPATQAWDAVALIYTHLPDSIRQHAHRALAQGLRQGGVVVMEAFHPEQLRFTSGGPKDVHMLYTPAMLEADFASVLDVMECWSGEVMLDEGPGHQGVAHVTRFVGRRTG